MLKKMITFFGERQMVACDGQCSKAWGIQGRPRKMLSSHIDDYVFLGDGEVGEAPPPGKTDIIAEGADVKPSATTLRSPEGMNKWCVRQCERSTMCHIGETPELPNMAAPDPNIPRP